MNTLQRTLLAIGAHADDIELDVGGTLLKYQERGYRIIYVMATNNMSGTWHKRTEDGQVRRETVPYHRILPQRHLEAAAAAAVFDTTPIHLGYLQRHYTGDDGCRYPVNYGTPLPEGLPAGVPNILLAHEDEQALEQVCGLILEHRPEAVLTHGHLGDNLEHIATCLLVTKAHRKAAAQGYTGMLLYWHDIAAITFPVNYTRWDTHVDVTLHWEEKIRLIGLHACQKPKAEALDFPPWNTACGCKHAEVFDIAARGVPPTWYSEFQVELYHHLR